MPTYTYRCSECGHEFEQFQRFSDDPLTECPACKGNVRRVLHPVGIVFKGAGFYVTDNRKPEPSEDGSAGKTGKNGTGSKKSDQAAKSDKVAAAAD